jgi:hypothetical protein
MAANELKGGGGSFYLQSKVYRAKELLDEFQADQRRAEQEAGAASPSASADSSADNKKKAE